MGTAYSSLINRTTRAFEISKGAWMANSVMEIYTAKGFDDITSNNNFTLSQFPNYTADVSTANMDYNLSNGTLTEGDENSLYKQITADITGPSGEGLVTFSTLRSICRLPAPKITKISTDYLANESSPRFAANTNNVGIKLHFDRAVDVSSLANIALDLLVTERVQGGDGTFSVSENPSSPITVNSGNLDAAKQNITFNYQPNAMHTSSKLDNYLDVKSLSLNGAAVTGLIDGSSDGCVGDLSIPIEDDSTLADDEVVVRSTPGVYYIYSDWDTVQAKIAPGEFTPPTFADIFNTWGRFDGNKYFANKNAAGITNNAEAWDAILDNEGNLETFEMDLNVDPANGFVSPTEVSNFTFEVTLFSSNSDNDMNGLVVAYEKGSNRCNNSTNNHDHTACTSSGSDVYVLIAGRTARGSEPRDGWGLMYGKGDKIRYSGAKTSFGTGDTQWTIRKKTTSGNANRSSWSSKYVRLKVERMGDSVAVHTTDWVSSRAAALNASYKTGDYILTINLKDDRRLHKFVGGSAYGYVTFSQPYSRYYDNEFPPPTQDVNTDYIVYFDQRNDSDNDDVYDQWDNFTMSLAQAGNADLATPSRTSGIWKWDATNNEWDFQVNLSIQDLAGWYRTISPSSATDPTTDEYFIKEEAENGLD